MGGSKPGADGGQSGTVDATWIVGATCTLRDLAIPALLFPGTAIPDDTTVQQPEVPGDPFMGGLLLNFSPSLSEMTSSVFFCCFS